MISRIFSKENRFSLIFWSTIIFLAVVSSYVSYYGYKKQQSIYIKKKVATLKDPALFQKKLLEKYPQIYKALLNISKESKRKIVKIINYKIDKLYEPVYENIDNFLDYHYSVTGEYSEVYSSLKGDLNNFLMEKIFGEDFDIRLRKTLNDINDLVLKTLLEENVKIYEKLKFLDFNKEESEYLLSSILESSYEDTKNRFFNLVNNIYKGGLATGVFVATKYALKKSSMLTAKALSKKILAKLSLKFGSKLLGVGTGVGLGAGAGLICGPYFYICSTAGAITGGLIAWLIMDKIIIEGDKFFNEDNFRKEIEFLITKNKLKLKKNLLNAYTKIDKKLLDEKLKKIKKFK